MSTRGAFLASSGALVVSLALPAGWSPAAAAGGFGGPVKPPLRPDQLDSFIAIEPDGMVTAFYGQIDGGQGLHISIAQIVAEELDVRFDRVRMVISDTARTVNQGGASGASGVMVAGATLRNTAAEARRVLVEAAAQRFGLPVSALRVANGVITASADRTQAVTYAELVGGRYFNDKLVWNGIIGNRLESHGKAKPKPVRDYTIVGTSIPRKDLPAKVYAQLDYVCDIKLPGMLHARMIRPPVAGAVPVRINRASIEDIPGAQIVHIKNLLAVVAPKEWNAVRAARDLEVTWSQVPPPFPDHGALFTHIRRAPVVKRTIEKESGKVDDAFANATRIVEAEYEWPLQSHSSLGPATALADVRDGHATLWTSTQKPHFARDGIADLLGLPVENVRAIWTWGTGSYGRNDQGDAGADAAVLSQALGKPVRVQYMRNEATGWDPKGTAAVNKLRAAIDPSGKVVAYELISKAFSRVNTSTSENRASATLAGQLLGVPLQPEEGFNIPLASYTFANNRLGWETIPPLLDRASPLRTTHLRDPYGPPILFGSESFMDELAVATGMDPVDFRARYLTHPRELAVLHAAAEKAGWRPRPASYRPNRHDDLVTGRGIAIRRHLNTFVASVAEIRVDRRTGTIHPYRLVVAHDCGLIVNPETLHHVIESQVVYAVSRTLYEEVHFDENNVTSVDWLTYPILDITQAPESVEILLINRVDQAPSGAAEIALGTIPAAIGNAFYDATGVRLRRVPLTPARVKAALSDV